MLPFPHTVSFLSWLRLTRTARTEALASVVGPRFWWSSSPPRGPGCYLFGKKRSEPVEDPGGVWGAASQLAQRALSSPLLGIPSVFRRFGFYLFQAFSLPLVAMAYVDQTAYDEKYTPNKALKSIFAEHDIPEEIRKAAIST